MLAAAHGLPPLPPTVNGGVMYQEEIISDLTKRFRERHFAIPHSEWNFQIKSKSRFFLAINLINLFSIANPLDT
ncbi:unnamed protein product [Nesidiocoris tenuis]|uniref:Uncharacterized protein n=1 Tax=Nesidiocoris tenuis TaxID=355587 RepID=A0A6H5FYS3_9HEMI|nr:unnamed protein product [Nesidiocoris tenuis]